MRFWLATAGVIIVCGVVALIIFLVISAALLKWGLISALILVGALMFGISWLLEKRREREYRNYQEDLTDRA
jgi:Flp pilus assembly protein TadB